MTDRQPAAPPTRRGRRAAARALAGLIVIAGCGGSSAAGPDPTASAVEPAGTSSPAVATPAPATEPVFMPTPTTVPTARPEPTTPPAPTATPEPSPTPQPEGPCDAGPLALPDPNRPVYVGSVTVDPPSRTIDGDLSVRFTPDLAVSELYLRLWPNGPRTASAGVALQLEGLAVDGVATDYDVVDATTIRVPLAQPLAAGSSLQLEMAFSGSVPVELRSRLSGRDDYMRLGTILPILPWEPGRGWALDAPTSLFAEAVSSPVADYSITVAVPDGFDVLASGVPDDSGTWRVEGARDFALSVGRFRTVTGIASAPEPVQVTVGVHDTLADDPQVYLTKVIDSLEQFSNRWGQYPWPSLTFAVTPGLNGGIEFPTHIMQGPGTEGRTTSHEVGHMFFYSLVGNNQGAEPWLDEGITSYAEFTYEGTAPGSFEIPVDGVGNATEPMPFWEVRPDIYYRSVYAQTGFALQLLGDQVDVDCALARYVATNAFAIATADDFVAAFEPTFPDVVEQMAALGVVIE